MLKKSVCVLRELWDVRKNRIIGLIILYSVILASIDLFFFKDAGKTLPDNSMHFQFQLRSYEHYLITNVDFEKLSMLKKELFLQNGQEKKITYQKLVQFKEFLAHHTKLLIYLKDIQNVILYSSNELLKVEEKARNKMSRQEIKELDELFNKTDLSLDKFKRYIATLEQSQKLFLKAVSTSGDTLTSQDHINFINFLRSQYGDRNSLLNALQSGNDLARSVIQTTNEFLLVYPKIIDAYNRYANYEELKKNWAKIITFIILLIFQVIREESTDKQ